MSRSLTRERYWVRGEDEELVGLSPATWSSRLWIEEIISLSL